MNNTLGTPGGPPGGRLLNLKRLSDGGHPRQFQIAGYKGLMHCNAACCATSRAGSVLKKARGMRPCVA